MGLFKLSVSFSEKDLAKAHGARWDAINKTWYFMGDELPKELLRWYTAPKPETSGKESTSDARTGLKSEAEQELPVKYDKYRTVSEVNRLISDKYNHVPEFYDILVKGEVTNFSGKKGAHYYFDIKDDNALLPCRLWDSVAAQALKFTLEKGQFVAIAGKLEFFEKSGQTQLIVREIENIGEGQSNLALLQLKAKLQAEGLFDVVHKKPIPKHPENVGIITSKNGQAIKDICKVAKKRDPYVQLVLFHVNVQGVNAVSTIVNGIKELDGMGLDSIIVGRGGGSDEELNVYNDEKIVRAVFEAKTPIVSAVGHEGHWTLIDYVSDKRVATPSEAAEETIPDIMADIKRVELLLKALNDNMTGLIENKKLLLEKKLALLLKNSPQNRLKENTERLKHLTELMDINIKAVYKSYQDDLEFLSNEIDNRFRFIYERFKKLPDEYLERIKVAVNQSFDRRAHRLEVLLTELNALSPTAKLVGGFGYVTKEGKPVRSSTDVKGGDNINIKMHDGDISANVL